ncbi:hypothetical protein PG990_008095 [Apiospora arundinis]
MIQVGQRIKMNIPPASLPAQRLLGKTVLITGAGGTIGLETATRMFQEGANLSLLDISRLALDAAVGILTAPYAVQERDAVAKSRILTITADCTDEAQVEACMNETIQKFGRLDCAFLVVGMSYESKSIFDTSIHEYDDLMRWNVKSAFLGLKHAARVMRNDTDHGFGGSIILTSSLAGLRGNPGLVVYSGAKFALRGFAVTAAAELGPLGIRVNTIHPSGIEESSMFQATWKNGGGDAVDDKLEALRRATPLGRLARADDVSGVVAFLASDDSKFVTGGFIKIDGGSVTF